MSELRSRWIFALVWNVIAAFGIAAVVLAPKEGDEWFLILIGLMVLIGLALLLDVIVRFLATRRSERRRPGG